MTVWVVSEDWDEDQRVLGVYSLEEKALAASSAWHSVIEFEIDAPIQG